MRYLLDTDIVSDLIRHPQGRVAQHIRKMAKRKSVPVSSSQRSYAMGA